MEVRRPLENKLEATHTKADPWIDSKHAQSVLILGAIRAYQSLDALTQRSQATWVAWLMAIARFFDTCYV